MEYKQELKDHPYFKLQGKNTGTEPRYISNRDNHQQVRFELGNEKPTAYGDSLSNALFGVAISGYGGSVLLEKRINHPKKATKPFEKPLPITIKSTFTADDLVDDFYSNPMDWSVNGNVYLALDRTIHAYKCSTDRWNKLVIEKGQESHYISALCTNATKVLYSTYHLGDNQSHFSLLDLNKNKSSCISPTLPGRYRVIRLSDTNPNLFFVGDSMSRLSSIDLRSPKNWSEKWGRTNKEICGMSVCGDIIATGDNGNRVRVWDIKNLKAPFFTYETHKAAVKALSFSVFNPSLLASAGGLSDKTLQLWDIKKQERISLEDTGQQICNLHWIDRNTLVTTHGYSENEPSLMHAWKIQGITLKCQGSTPPEDGRILYSTQNPNNSSLFFVGNTNKSVSLIEVGEKKVNNPYAFNINAIR